MNTYDQWYEYDGDKKIYLGHKPKWYYDNYQPNMSKDEIFQMLVRAVRKYINHSNDAGCEIIPRDEMYDELCYWFNEDSTHEQYFLTHFPEILEEDDNTVNDILDASNIFDCC